MTVTALSQAAIDARLAELRGGEGSGYVGADTSPLPSSLITPLADTAGVLLDVLHNSDGRYMLGLDKIDVLTRGFAPSTLVLVVGFSTGGKTKLLLSSVVRNLDKRILILSMDDPAALVLRDLVCMVEELSPIDFEEWAKAHPQEAGTLLVDHANKTFANLLVYDQPATLRDVDGIVADATSTWGAPPDMVAVDYVQYLTEQGDDIRRTIQGLKVWANQQPFPVIAIHQGTRSNAKPGDEITLLSGAFAGEQEATIQLGVWRKRERADLTEGERHFHENTVTIAINKNKWTAKRTPRDGIDFELLPSGKIVTLNEAEYVRRHQQTEAFDGDDYVEDKF